MRQHQWRETIALLHRELAGDVPELLWNLGWAHFKLREYDDAAVALRKALACRGEKAPAAFHWALAFALLETGEVDEAETEFRTALQLRDSHIASLGLALLYLRAGDRERAEAVHRASVARRPDSRERVQAYADFLCDIGRDADAREHYQRARMLWSDEVQ